MPLFTKKPNSPWTRHYWVQDNGYTALQLRFYFSLVGKQKDDVVFNCVIERYGLGVYILEILSLLNDMIRKGLESRGVTCRVVGMTFSWNRLHYTDEERKYVRF